MKILATPADMLHEALTIRASGKTIGFVPTMGALHKGHIALLKRAIQTCDVAVASVFVNPTQFNNPTDYTTYPRTVSDDLLLLEDAGCYAVFLPEVVDMYPSPTCSAIDVGRLNSVYEGKHRPGHFSGVALVVVKLLNMVQPTHAFFGTKDLQQVAVVRQVVHDLSLPVQVVECPTLREPDGLAMSSRNMLLSKSGRQLAPALHASLQSVRKGYLQGILDQTSIETTVLENKGFKVEYLDVVHKGTFRKPGPHDSFTDGNFHVVIAAWLEQVRLIDNIPLIQ